MKFLSLILILAFSTTGWAEHLDTVCSGAKQKRNASSYWNNGPSFTENYVLRRSFSDQGARFLVEKQTGELILDSKTKFLDISEQNETLWLLSEYSLTQINLAGESLQTIALAEGLPTGLYSKARSMTLLNDVLFVAMGRNGIVAIDTKTAKPLWRDQFAEEHMPISVVALDSKIYVAMFNISFGNGETPFYMELTLEDNKVIDKRMFSTNPLTAMHPYVKMTAASESVIINNGGSVHVLSVDPWSSGIMRWMTIVEEPPKKGMSQQYAQAIGEVLVKDDKLTVCASHLKVNKEGHSMPSKKYILEL